MKITDKFVFFWQDRPFTNFTPCPELVYLGIKWRSTEQAFMWIKAVEFKDYEIAQQIREAKTPREAKALGRKVSNFDTEHWSNLSYSYMKQLVDIKFRSNPKFLSALLNPLFQGKTFVEASPFDRVWGIGYNQENALTVWEGSWGENRLGKILTELRNQYIEEFKNYGYGTIK